MAEDFLEPIYQDAKIFSELKQIVEWIRIYNVEEAVEKWNQLTPSLTEICKKYLQWNAEQGQNLWNHLQQIICKDKDLQLFCDAIEHDLLPLLEDYMKQWGEIYVEDDLFTFETTLSGFLTMKDVNRNMYLHSTLDPMWEARMLAKYIYEPDREAYSILGCSLGYLAYQLYDISAGSIVINIFEPNAKMVEYALQYGVLAWIPKDRLNITIDEDVLPFLNSAANETVGFYIFPPVIQELPEETKSIISELSTNYITAKMHSQIETINFYRNVRGSSKAVSEFDRTCLKKEFVVVAAGPSLDDNLVFLRECKGKKTIIAVGTVFRKLVQKNIIPDIVVILDPREPTFKQLEGVEDQKVPMILGLTAYWEFAAKYQGETYLVPITGTQNCINYNTEYAREHHMNQWQCGGTVTSLGIETAIQFGAKKIYLVGLDLAFPGGYTHAKDTIARTKINLDTLIPVEGVGNQTVYADTSFIIYKKQIEEQIAHAPEITYVNMSKTGVRIHGTEELI